MSAERVATERVRELLAAAPPGPWTHERVGFGGNQVVMDARHGVFTDGDAEAALIAAAPDLGADLLDARALHAAVADALELQPTATPEQCVEAARVLTGALTNALHTLGAQSRLLAGKHTPEDAVSLLVSGLLGHANEAPNSAEYRGSWLGRRFALTVQWVDGKTPGEMITEAEAQRDAALAALRGTYATPTPAEARAHAAARGWWLVSYDDQDGEFVVAPLRGSHTELAAGVEAAGDNPVRWVAVDRTGSVCPRPTEEVPRG